MHTNAKHDSKYNAKYAICYCSVWYFKFTFLFAYDKESFLISFILRCKTFSAILALAFLRRRNQITVTLDANDFGSFMKFGSIGDGPVIYFVEFCIPFNFQRHKDVEYRWLPLCVKGMFIYTHADLPDYLSTSYHCVLYLYKTT